MQRLNPRRAGPPLSIALQENLYFAVEHSDRVHRQRREPVQFAALIAEVDSLDETTRGAGGFGSTGR